MPVLDAVFSSTQLQYIQWGLLLLFVLKVLSGQMAHSRH
jgi:hypothetical protein